MSAVFLMVQVLTANGEPVTVSVAVWGMFIGEAGSAVYSYLVYAVKDRNNGRRPQAQKHAKRRRHKSESSSFVPSAGFLATAVPLMAMAVPLMGNRLILNCLQSLSNLCPNRLIEFGLNHSDALSMYGVLTGMALPFIYFPSAITNSLSVVLLPTVAEAQAQENTARIEKTIYMALRYSLYMGILCV